VGAVSFDKDAIYIDIGRVNYTKKKDIQGDDTDIVEPEYNPEEPAGVLKGLQDVDAAVNDRIERSTLRLFKGSKAVEAGSGDDSDDDKEESDDQDEQMDDSSDDEDDEEVEGTEIANTPFRTRKRNAGKDSDGTSDSDDDSRSNSEDEDDSDDQDDSDDSSQRSSEEDDEENAGSSKPKKGGAVSWKDNIAERATKSFLERQSSMLNLQEFINGTKSKVVIDDANDEDDGAESSDDDEFFKLKKSSRETAPT
jgi:ribosome biogenesis protein BMS1